MYDIIPLLMNIAMYDIKKKGTWERKYERENTSYTFMMLKLVYHDI